MELYTGFERVEAMQWRDEGRRDERRCDEREVEIDELTCDVGWALSRKRNRRGKDRNLVSHRNFKTYYCNSFHFFIVVNAIFKKKKKMFLLLITSDGVFYRPRPGTPTPLSWVL